MNKVYKTKFNQKDYDRGIELSVSIQFIQCDDDPTKMEVLSFTIWNGLQSIDYSDVINSITLKDILEEFKRE